MEKKNIKKYAGVGVLSMALTAGAVGIAIGCYESSVDHINEYCHLCDIIGLQHQADAINNGTNGFRYQAIYETGEDKTLESYTDSHVINYAHKITSEDSGCKDLETYSICSNILIRNLTRAGYSFAPYLGERVDIYDNDGTLERSFKY